MSEGVGVVRTAAGTAAVAGAAYLIARAFHQSAAIGVVLAVLIGGIGLLVRFLVEFENRLAAVEQLGRDGLADMRRLVGDAFSEISDATALFGLIEASALPT